MGLPSVLEPVCGGAAPCAHTERGQASVSISWRLSLASRLLLTFGDRLPPRGRGCRSLVFHSLEERDDIRPKFLPILPLGFRQLCESVAAHPGEIGVLLPVLHLVSYGGAGFRFPAVELPCPSHQVRP